MSLSPIPLGPRQEQSVAPLGSEVFIVGGTDSIHANATFMPSVQLAQAYSTTNNTWRRVADLSIPINHGNVASVHGKLYVLGALVGNGDNIATGAGYMYSPLENAWTGLPSQPAGTYRGASAVGIWKDNIVLAGGLINTNFFTGAQDTIPWTSMFNTRTLEWDTRLPDLLDQGRDHAGAAVVGNTFYVVGGRVSGGTNVRGNVVSMDLSAVNRTGVEKASMPTPRGESRLERMVDGKIYTFGGEGNPLVASGIFDNVEVYDTKTDSWEVLSPVPIPRHGTRAAVVDGRIYIPGGADKEGAGATDSSQVFFP